MSSRTVYTTTIDRLIREADRLERAWDHPDVDAGSVTNQMLAVLRTLENDPRRRTRDEEADEAARLLRLSCSRCGRRDIARAADLRARGVRPSLVSLDALRESGWDAQAPDPAFADWEQACDDAERRERVFAFLEGAGLPRERACAFVWHYLDGLEWAEVADAMQGCYGARVSAPVLRQWAKRQFHPLLRRLYAHLRRRDDFDWLDGDRGAVTPGPEPGITPTEGTKRRARTRRKEVTPMSV